MPPKPNRSKTPNYLETMLQSNQDIRLQNRSNTSASSPKPSRLDAPPRRLRSVVFRVPQGSPNSTKENRPPSQDFRDRSDYRPTISRNHRHSENRVYSKRFNPGNFLEYI